jgi:hypothetical protein
MERSDIIFSDLWARQLMRPLVALLKQAHAARKSKFGPCASFCRVPSFRASRFSTQVVARDGPVLPSSVS